MPNPIEEEALRKQACQTMIVRVWHSADRNSSMEREAVRILTEAKARLDEVGVSFHKHVLTVTLNDGDLDLLIEDPRTRAYRAKVRREGAHLQEMLGGTVAAEWDTNSATFKPTGESGCTYAVEAVLKVALEELTGKRL